MESGHWFHTNAEVDVCTGWDGLTLTLPREVEVPLAVNIDGSPTYFRNRFFQYHVNKGGMYSPVEWAWDDRGFVSTMMEIVQPSQLVAIAESNNDAGKTLRILGLDSNNRTLHSQTNSGIGVDGLILSIHSLQDFQNGNLPSAMNYAIIGADDAVIKRREATTSPLTDITTSLAFAGGEPVQTNAELSYTQGQTYYAGTSVDNGNNTYTTKLYTDQLNAINGQYPVERTSTSNDGGTLIDSRNAKALTSVNFINGAPSVVLTNGNEITFTKNNDLDLPAPLVENQVYFSSSPDSENLFVYNSLTDAVNDTNRVYMSGGSKGGSGYSSSPSVTFSAPAGDTAATGHAVVTNGVITSIVVDSGGSYANTHVPAITITDSTGSGARAAAVMGALGGRLIVSSVALLESNFSVNIRKPINAITELLFEIPHTYADGDIVQAFANGGVLPKPLVAAQNYYVHAIDEYTITLHENNTDAISGKNPIILTSTGSGNVSLVKQIPAAVAIGSENNIISPAFTLPTASGSGAIITAQPSGIVTSINVTTQGVGYSSEPKVHFSSAGGSGYSDTSSGRPSVVFFGSGTGATASVTINSNGSVSGVTMLTSGTGYTPNTTVEFVGGSGTGAAGIVNVNPDGTIAGVTLQELGSGASARAILGQSGSDKGKVLQVVINNAGSGYVSAPLITIDAPADPSVWGGSTQSYIIGDFVKYTTPLSSIANWLANTAYNVGDLVQYSGSPYRCTTATTGDATFPVSKFTAYGLTYYYSSKTNHAGTPDQDAINWSQQAVSAWANSHAYVVGELVQSGGNFYRCKTAFTSASSGGIDLTKFDQISAWDNSNKYNNGTDLNSYAAYSGSCYKSNYIHTGLPDGDSQNWQTYTPTTAVAQAILTTSFINNYTIVNGGSGYTYPPSLKVVGGNGTGAVATTIIKNGAVTGVTVVAEGTGYTTAPSVVVTPSTGVFVEFSSTGTLPEPIQQGVSYRAEAPSSSTSFTIVNPDYSPVAITSTGTGTFYIAITRSFSVGFNGVWQGDFAGLNNGDTIYFGTDYLLPQTIPFQIDNGVTPFYIRPFDATHANIYDNQDIASANNWDSGTTYTTGQAVAYQGDIWIASSTMPAHPNQIPTTSPYWARVQALPYDASVTYQSGYYATYAGSVWRAIATNTNVIPTQGSYWTFVAADTTAPTYSSGTTYQKNYRVTYGGQTYIALQATTGNLPTNTTFWTTSPISSFYYNSATSYTGNNYVYYSSSNLSLWVGLQPSLGQYPPYSNPLVADPAFWNKVPPVEVSVFGSGQTYYAVRVDVCPVIYNQTFVLDNLEYLNYENNKVILKISSTGTLPTPLVNGNVYQFIKNSYGLQILNQTLSGIGTGAITLSYESSALEVPTSSFIANNHLFETGTKVGIVVSSGNLSSQATGTINQEPANYYVRRIDSNTFEIYDTFNNANNIQSTVGRKVSDSIATFFVDGIYDPVLVKSVSSIDKPVTDGYVSLYALDYGRSNDMTLIGQYHPTETNPKYRRIKLGKPCAWARILYRVRHPNITSVYDYIPLENERAIIAAVHAVDLEDKDFIDQSVKYWQIAIGYLKNQQESMDGHAMTPPQINNITYGDGTDPVIDSGYWGNNGYF